MVDNSSVVNNWDTIIVSHNPLNPLRIYINGDLPTDKTKVSMDITFYDGTAQIFSCGGSWKVQGASSSGADKKNWKLFLVNATTNNPLLVKFGTWFAASSFVLKAYATDRTLIRDSLSTMTWRGMREVKTGFIGDLSVYQYWASKNCGEITSAEFTTSGYPVEVYRNGSFLGMYVLRANNSVIQYGLDSSNSRHYMLSSGLNNNFWIDGVYTAANWEILSPGTVPSDSTTTVTRIIKWFSDCYKGTVDIRSTYHQYIDLSTFIDYLLFDEVTVNFDSIVNNLDLISYNATATSGVWGLYPYDMDQTFGIVGGSNTTQNATPENVGWVTKPDRMLGGQNPAFFGFLHTAFRPEIFARWNQLRNSGAISSKRINEYILEQTKIVNPNLMQEDLALWPLSGKTGLGTGIAISDNGKRNSIAYISDYAKRRIAWLDKQFNY